MILISVFIFYAWKWSIFKRWLVLVPNLNGIWEGEIQSTWIDPQTNDQIAPIKTKLEIKQNLLQISCVMKTGEMRSDSIVADVVIDKEKQKAELHYNYISDPKATFRHRSEIHYGAIIFNYSAKTYTLEGSYWTDRKTTGYIKLEHTSK